MSRKIQITTRNEMQRYTKLVIDGIEIDKIVAIHIDIGVGNIAYLTIQRHAVTDEDQVICGDDEAAITTQTSVFSGMIEGILSKDLAEVIVEARER